MQPPKTRKPIAAGFVLATLLYFGLAAYLVSCSLDVMTADAVSYLRIAQYYADGRFDLAVNSCWGPLLSWLLVPAAALDLDLPLAVRIVQVLSGLGFAAAVALLTRRFAEGRGALLGFIAGGLLALPMMPSSITPDMTLAFLITLYFHLAAPLLTGSSLSWAVAAGLVGGIAFLTKHFALPFVVVHLALTLAFRWVLIRKKLLVGPLLRPVIAAAVAFFAVALPWIGVMSLHDGHFTVSSAGPYAKATTYAIRHGLLYPDHQLQELRPGRIVVSENRLEGKYGLPEYPPALSAEGLKDRLGHLKYYGARAIGILKGADLFGLLLAAAFVTLFQCLWSVRFLTSRRGVYGFWALCSVALYVAGYVVTNVEERLLWPVWGILLALALAIFVFPAVDSLDRPGRGVFARFGSWIFGLLLVFSIGFDTADQLRNAREDLAWYTYCRSAAETMPLQGRFAVNAGQNRLLTAFAVAYWSDIPLLGVIQGRTADAIAGELAPFGEVQALIVSDPDLVAQLQHDPRFSLLESRTTGSEFPSLSLFAFHP